jgi:hypothetical protein
MRKQSDRLQKDAPLRLDRETLRSLEVQVLRHAAGGDTHYCHSGPRSGCSACTA